MKVRAVGRFCAAVFAVLGVGVSMAPVAGAAPQPINSDDCKRDPGASAPTSTWALDRLELAKVNSITRGRTVGTGVPVPVAVIDSGLDRAYHPQLRGLTVAKQRDAIVDDPGAAFDDCAGHGTQVTAILAAQPDPSRPDFVGVAPEVKVIPIKVTNGQVVEQADVARGIDLAIDAGAKIANVSLSLPVQTSVLRAAVARAQRAGMLIVAAAGNDGNAANRFAQYPAAYATEFDNVLGVGAATPDNTVASFSGSGRYVGVVAPGAGVQTIGVAGGYLVIDGTSFAAPYVSGVAALVLAANPGLTAKALRDRIEATAAAPPASVPDTRWGYGTVDPYVAVTSVRIDAPPSAPSSARPQPVAVGKVQSEPDRTLQNVSIAVALGLLALALAVVAAASVFRGSRRRPSMIG